VRVARNEEGEVAVEIIDNGIGLPTEGRERLLEPYMTTREKGTGLGLAIVRKIAEEQGGRIELLDASAVSDNTRGACIRFVLPPMDDA
ncbi:MAG: ATP-binding protein, partial [Pseudomonadota bacterium]